MSDVTRSDLPRNASREGLRDRTRVRTAKRVFYSKTFRAYLVRRFAELLGDRSPYSDEAAEIVHDLGRALNVTPRRVGTWVRWAISREYSFGDGPLFPRTIDRFNVPAISDEDYRAFAEWEAASRRLLPLRSIVATVRQCPGEASREDLVRALEELDAADRAKLRLAIYDYLTAIDVAGEARALGQHALDAASALLAERVAAEPLIACAEVF